MTYSCPPEYRAPFDQAWYDALAGGLGLLWGPQAVVQLGTAPQAWKEEVAVEALGGMGPTAIPNILEIASLGNLDPEVVGHSLSNMGRQAVPALFDGLDTQNEHVRLGVVNALGWMALYYDGSTEIVPVLIQSLEEEMSSVRAEATRALGLLGSGAVDAIPALVVALGDEAAVVRKGAAFALGRVGSDADGTIPALIHTLDDEDRGVVASARHSLKRITGQDFGTDTAAWQEWWESQDTADIE